MSWDIIQWALTKFNGNGKYVKKVDCHREMDNLKDTLREFDKTQDTRMGERFKDLKDFIRIINGK